MALFLLDRYLLRRLGVKTHIWNTFWNIFIGPT